MYLVYVGESGNTGNSTNDSRQPHHVYLALMIHDGQWNEIKAEFNYVCRHFFGPAFGREGGIRQLRAGQILQGTSFFSSWPRSKRLELIQILLSILIKRETPLLVSYVDKQEYATAQNSGSGSQLAGRGLWQSAFSRLVFSLDLYLDEMNMAAMSQEEMIRGDPVKIQERAAIIADMANHSDRRVMRELLQTELDLPTGTLLENVYFVRAPDSHCTQLANICAYFLRRHLQQPDRPSPQYIALEEGRLLEVIYPVQFE